MKWYCVRVRIVVVVEGDEDPFFDDCLLVIQWGEEQVMAQFLSLAGKMEKEYLNGEGERVRWRLVEITTLDSIEDEIDGATVHFQRLPIDNPSEHPFTQTYGPWYRSDDLTSTIGPQSTDDDEDYESTPIDWYCAHLRFVRLVQDLETTHYYDEWIVFQDEFGSELERAIELGKLREKTIVNEAGRTERRCLVKVLTIGCMGSKLDGTEIYSEFMDIEQPDLFPFERAYSPENSQPKPTLCRDTGYSP